MNYIVVDLESTCDSQQDKIHGSLVKGVQGRWIQNRAWDNETIEIGALKFHTSSDHVDEHDVDTDLFELSNPAHLGYIHSFHQYIQPTKNPELTHFCKKLTGIDQSDIQDAGYFPDVVQDFYDFCSDNESAEYVLCSWGFYDKKQFERDCIRYELPLHWLKHHISIKHQYAQMAHIRPCGVMTALKKEGWSFQGRLHSGFDDAVNIARLFVKHFNQFTFPKG